LSTRSRARTALSWISEIALLAGAVWLLRHELRGVPLDEILRDLRALPTRRVWAALLLTGAGYLAFAGYDLVALRLLKRSLPVGRVIISAFIGYALANNAPLSFLVGGSVRYRFYSGWGLASKDATALVLLNVLTYALGLATAAGLAFTLEPHAVPAILKLPFGSTRPLGVAALVAVGTYLAATTYGGPLRLWRWRLVLPRLSTSLLQIGVSLVDWLLSGAALFVLLPLPRAQLLSSFGFFGFFGLFLLGQIAALIAQVPGGLGVFEAVMLATLAPVLPAGAVFSSLLAYRVIYYFVPLAVAATLLGVRGLTHLRRHRT
jgi:phosphatidylglycerol lysyltransferase